MNARFYVPTARTPGHTVTLPEAEAQHLTRVLRLKAGDPVRVFNGRGLEFHAVIESASKRAVTVRIHDPCAAAPEPRVAVTLAQAVLKGDSMDEVVRDAVMMGVAAIQPLVSARAETTLGAVRRGRRRERWERIAVASAKQCGRAVVPVVLEPRPFDELPGAVAARELPGPAFMLVEPAASLEAARLGDLEAAAPQEATVIVGPEGGWTPEEVSRASTACGLVTLGGRTLRADAAALVALAALFQRWGEF
ncbi:MAG TPA: 16S rRNA (uracil(1498)-N(3))-methyltransferase [Vicinamibacterales bacterium]|nr:16S rRNA (uracil(1498)-N(3))-methyltransferase [Vicinamibacterales bacterium]